MSNKPHIFIRGLHNLRAEHHGSVVTIGSFDGVHLGHQAILHKVCDVARQSELPSVAMIFEPQPQEYFSGELAPARLMRLREKTEALFAAGVDRVFCLPFNRQLRSLSAREFVERILVDGLGVRTLVVGDDFRFGCDRGGDFAMLQTVGTELGERGFQVIDTRTVSSDHQRISSTRVRSVLDSGNFEEAAALLGKPFTISGRVVYGQQLGRQLGVPTANLNLHRYRAPLTGVFAVTAETETGQVLQGVANVGVRPTVADCVKPILEVHLFDWSGDIYGQRLIVEFKAKIRDEQKFASLEELKAAIGRDIEQAKGFFASGTV